MKRQIDGAIAVHDFTHTFGRAMSPEAGRAAARIPARRHPVVRTHPLTGRRCLYVNAAFTSHIEGIAPDASRALLEHLYRQADVPEYQCRFRWQKNSSPSGTTARSSTTPCRTTTRSGRVMERVTIIGETPR